MRTPLILLSVLSAASVAVFCFAADPRTQQSAPGQDKLFVFCEGGTSLTPTNIIYRENVKVFESDMYLECELLTLLQQAVRPPGAGSTGGFTNLNSQLDTIIAETNLLLMARGTTVIGDKAVYTRSNETVVVTGDLVVIERSNILFFATNFVFNRLTTSGYAIGWTATEVDLRGSFGGTNALRPGFGPIQKPRAPVQPKSDGAK